MAVFNNQLTKFLKTKQLALGSWFKQAPEHHSVRAPELPRV